VNRFQFFEDHHRAWGVKRLCAVLEVARSSFYKWRAGSQARTACGPAARPAPHASGPMRGS
jgi:hypothetical protein